MIMQPKKYKFIPVDETTHAIILQAKNQQAADQNKAVTFNDLLLEKFTPKN